MCIRDRARNAELIKLLQSLDYAFVPGALASLYTAEYVRKGDYKGMLNSMREAFKYNVLSLIHICWEMNQERELNF